MQTQVHAHAVITAKATSKKDKFAALLFNALIAIAPIAAALEAGFWTTGTWISNPAHVTVDLSDRTLTHNGTVYPVQVGDTDTPTPVGDFVVRQDWDGKASVFTRGYLPIDLGFYPFLPFGFFGIHGGTDGTPTNGCISMFDAHYQAIALKEGDTITIKP